MGFKTLGTLLAVALHKASGQPSQKPSFNMLPTTAPSIQSPTQDHSADDAQKQKDKEESQSTWMLPIGGGVALIGFAAEEYVRRKYCKSDSYTKSVMESKEESIQRL